MAGIFISYRREDSGIYAGRLNDVLVKHFGQDSVFFDTETIGLGEDFREVIQQTWSSCKVVLVVIGKQWATVQDKTGKLRLDSESDLLRIEIASALQNGLRIIPVLVGGAEMPEASTLPSDIRDIVYRNAWDVSDKRFHQDAEVLVDAIKKVLGVAQPNPTVAALPRETLEQSASVGENSASTEPRSRSKPRGVVHPSDVAMGGNAKRRRARRTRAVAKTRTPALKRSRSVAKTRTPDLKPSSSEPSLFPVYGIILGKTTVDEVELSGLGSRSTYISERTGEPDLSIEVQGSTFFYDGRTEIVNSMHLTVGFEVPETWQVLGFDWDKSYNQWISWLKGLGYSIKVPIQPHVEQSEGHDSFRASVCARKKTLHPHEIWLMFAASEGTTTWSPKTLRYLDITSH